jgi:hypothetical protein
MRKMRTKQKVRTAPAKHGRGQTRTEQIPIRFSQQERARVEQVAAREHDYASTFLRRLILKQIDRDEQQQRAQEMEVAMSKMA